MTTFSDLILRCKTIDEVRHLLTGRYGGDYQTLEEILLGEAFFEGVASSLKEFQKEIACLRLNCDRINSACSEMERRLAMYHVSRPNILQEILDTFPRE